MSDTADTTELSPEEILAQLNQAKKDRWLSIFIQLSRSKRFTQFVEDNYDITDRVDHEAKTIETLVIEKPIAVGPKIAPAQMFKIYTFVSKLGAKDVNKSVAELLELLGQESSVVLTADTPIVPGKVTL